ncbi:BlaI/MecI/CopY family transcriptional regulator [Candidatus Uabimicrobium sp. HlEnr_7]|uniref:BlaI/MecI/CopY family transcriptional regulator n=1 Tax=Candidatus Uabimicrobium helgolandensis TaxID=3095367 RepID=UPI0035570AAD
MNNELQKLSDSEWLIMKACWISGKSTARDIYQKVVKKKKWEYTTVKTMLDRLVKKEYLEFEKLGNLCLYTPCTSNKSVTESAIKNFMNTILDHNFMPIFLYFAKDRKIPSEDLESLKKLIEEYDQ